MIYFVKQYESEYNEIINFEYFLFAIAAIRMVVSNYIKINPMIV